MQIQNQKTIVGNRIDDRLALGMARGILTRFGHRLDIGEVSPERSLKTHSERSRRASLKIIEETMGRSFLGMVARKGYFEARYAHLVTMSAGSGKLPDTLAVLKSDVDLHSGGGRDSYHAEHWPFTQRAQVFALIEVHAIARLFQRGGAHDETSALDVLLRAASWSAIASRQGEEGSWMLPTDSGLICARNQYFPESEYLKYGPEPVAVIKTFVGKDDMTDQSRYSWEALKSIGAMHTTPKLATWRDPDPEHVAIWQSLRNEGRAWDFRRQHARRARPSACENTTDCAFDI